MKPFPKIKYGPYIHRGLAFVCPRCNEFPSVDRALVVKAVRALYVPYFLCSECRLAHIHTGVVRAKVKYWWEDSGGPTSGSLQYWQKSILAYMRKLQRYYTDSIGYCFLRRFKRVRLQATK